MTPNFSGLSISIKRALIDARPNFNLPDLQHATIQTMRVNMCEGWHEMSVNIVLLSWRRPKSVQQDRDGSQVSRRQPGALDEDASQLSTNCPRRPCYMLPRVSKRMRTLIRLWSVSRVYGMSLVARSRASLNANSSSYRYEGNPSVS